MYVFVDQFGVVELDVVFDMGGEVDDGFDQFGLFVFLDICDCEYFFWLYGEVDVVDDDCVGGCEDVQFCDFEIVVVQVWWVFVYCQFDGVVDYE